MHDVLEERNLHECTVYRTGGWSEFLKTNETPYQHMFTYTIYVKTNIQHRRYNTVTHYMYVWVLCVSCTQKEKAQNEGWALNTNDSLAGRVLCCCLQYEPNRNPPHAEEEISGIRSGGRQGGGRPLELCGSSRLG